MNKITQLWNYIVSAPNHTALAIKELENAKKGYLENKTHQEYYSNLCSFDAQRIKRLEQYLGLVDHL